MSRLAPQDFEDYFSALHDGAKPFPWQQRLAERVLAPGKNSWPQALALPTASGKTACIDIAIFALAAQASLPPEKRTAPRRILFVVDRRVIVDEAFQRAKDIAQKLRTAGGGILKIVKDALRTIAGDPVADPLACFQLRGGVYRDDAWAHSPMQPTVIASTVDQVGSRLLFRGYGVSAGMRPIHAALIANDSLIVLDEAHCARPFMESLLAVERYRAWGSEAIQAPFRVVLMSATPPAEITDVERAASDDLSHSILGARLKAPKPARLVIAENASGKKAQPELAAKLVSEALALAGDGPPKAVGIIVNRVATARAIHAELVKTSDRDALLLIGRMRPLDSQRVSDDLRRRLKSNDPAKPPLEKHLFVVATQTIEVGADFDFDALATECASLDALRQRFGRLNRAGRPIDARAAIVIRADQTKPAAKPADADPIYSDALALTWRWLGEQSSGDEIDFGVSALDARIEAATDNHPDALKPLLAPITNAPVMLPAYVDCWAQTSPEPSPSPDPAIFLHGPERGLADVHLCWRSDLPTVADNGESWINAVSLCSPAAAELMPVPFTAFVRWFAGDEAVDDQTGDVEGDSPAFRGLEEQQSFERMALRWRGPDDSELVRGAGEIRPGDTLVLPASAGGWNILGHVPAEHGQPARIDVGDEANLAARAKPILRLHPKLVAAWPEGPGTDLVRDWLKAEDFSERLGEREFIDELRAALRSVSRAKEAPSWLCKVAGFFAGSPGRLSRELHVRPDGAVVLRAAKTLKDPRSHRRAAPLPEGDDESSAAETCPLQKHLDAVAAQLEAFLAGCSLPASVKADAILAAHLHDWGKADLRFQAWLRGGDRRAIGELLAKSEGMPLGRAASNAARERAGYPRGGRHEFLSVRLAEGAEALLAGAANRDLVLHLVSSHHGYGRPFAPVIPDPCPEEVTFRWNGGDVTASSHTGLECLGGGVPERFWRLVRRHGWWGIAYLETLLRLADHRASEAEFPQPPPITP